MLLYKTAQQTLKTGLHDFIFSQCTHLLEIRKLERTVKNLAHKSAYFMSKML